MYHVSLPMAVMDYVPVLFFLVTTIILQWSLYDSMYKGAYALLAAGTINIFIAGFLKATWKLLYASGAMDFYLVNEVFLPLQSLGFLLMGAGVIGMMAMKKRIDEKTSLKRVLSVFLSIFFVLVVMAVILSLSHSRDTEPPRFRGTMIFIAMMVGGLGCLCVTLSILSVRVKKPWLIAFFALSFILSLTMGYLSSHDSHSAVINWIEESVNTLSQAFLMVGTMILHKSGLSRVSLKKEEN